MIILDTNVISEPLRPRPDQRVAAWLDLQVLETLHLTTITLAEVRFGIAALPDGARKTMLHERFEEEVLPLFSGRVLTFDEPAATRYAEIRARTRLNGAPIGDFDALIAGIAASRGFVLASRDTRPFRAAGVDVVDPFAAEG